MNCQDCGFENAKDVKVCINCGAGLEGNIDNTPQENHHPQPPTSSDCNLPHPIMTPTPPGVHKAGPSSPPHQPAPMGIHFPKTNAMPPINESETLATNLPNGTLYIILAVIETLCCCHLFGAIGLILAILGKTSEAKGNYNKARSLYKTAKLMLLLGILGALILLITLTIIIIPSIQEAKTSATVSKTHADMRVTATALEFFYIDNNYFLPYTESPQEAITLGIGKTSSTPTFTSKMKQYELTSLTTPVAYMASYFEDPFNKDHPFCYITEGNHWLLFSAGPDGDLDITSVEYKSHEHNPKANWDWLIKLGYDPTNGVHSSGDIWYSNY